MLVPVCKFRNNWFLNQRTCGWSVTITLGSSWQGVCVGVSRQPAAAPGRLSCRAGKNCYRHSRQRHGEGKKRREKKTVKNLKTRGLKLCPGQSWNSVRGVELEPFLEGECELLVNRTRRQGGDRDWDWARLTARKRDENKLGRAGRIARVVPRIAPRLPASPRPPAAVTLEPRHRHGVAQA